MVKKGEEVEGKMVYGGESGREGRWRRRRVDGG